MFRTYRNDTRFGAGRSMGVTRRIPTAEAGAPAWFDDAPRRHRSFQPVSINWNDLRIVLAIGETGSVAAAARVLGVDASTTSRRLTALEEALGTRLFERTPTGLTTTPAGEIAIATARRVGCACDEMIAALGSGDDALGGVVRLTASEGFAHFVVALLAELRTTHPEIHVDLQIDNRSVDLLKREVDIAIRGYRDTHPDLIVRPLAKIGWGLFAHERYLAARGVPETPADLQTHDVVGYDASMATSPGGRWICDHVAPTRVVFRGNSTRSAVVATSAALGVGVLPAFMIADVADVRRVVPTAAIESEMFVVYTTDARRLARVRAVAEHIVAGFTHVRDWLAGGA